MATPEDQSLRNRQLEVITNLKKQYGGSLKIPEGELDSLGYVRKVMEDGLVRLMPREQLEELSRKNPDWEKPLKEKEQPFGRISVELQFTSENFRFIPNTQSALLSEKLTELECAFFPNWDDMEGTSILPSEYYQIDVRVQNLSKFSQDILDFMKQKKVMGDGMDVGYYELLLFGALPMRFSPDNPAAFGASDFRHHYEEPNRSIKGDRAKEMYDELSRLSGFYGDVHELRRIFRHGLEAPTTVEQSLKGGNTPQELKALEWLSGLGIKTNADFIRYMFPKYLEHIGLNEMAAVIRTSRSPEALGESLTYLDAADNFREEEQAIKKALKTASAEERIELNSRLKDLDKDKRKRKQVRQGVIDYFSAPEVYTDVVRRKIKDVQDFLVGGAGKKNNVMEFFLDGNPNPELDRDPGTVSGDCTAGKPLPFDMPSLPLYNVKALTTEGQHIGNIYLLVTNTKDEDGQKKRKVWHLEAIQIPQPSVDWHSGIERIMEAIGDQAEVKGVDAVTANSELHLISNYDYIAKRVEEYWRSQGSQMVNVEMPDVRGSDTTSEFQGNGEDIVLWSKEKLSDARTEDLDFNDDLFELQNQQ